MKKRKLQIELDEDDEILDRKITKFGNSSHAVLPLKHRGKRAKIIIKKEGK
ncbi:hypothetical protein LCGC14_1859160 [marine sediment metagenome]|uniref:Uncharacterized protein n=1 Tax=marine sediment metagenome TaxID=412755 RepID=A0A0F9GWG2_9ZZZZ